MPIDIEAARSTIQNVRHHDPSALRERIRTLAKPRLSGTEGAVEVEQQLREELEELGYETKELPFSFSGWPGRFGLPAAGVVLMLTGAGAGALLLGGLPIVALVVLVVGLVLTLLPLILLETAQRILPVGRMDARNLLFTRPGARPKWIVMAHRDSKSQLIPTLGRTAAVVIGATGWVTLVVVAVLWLAGELFQFETWVFIAGGAVVLAGLAFALAWASNDSPGALDNASGLAALLAVAAEAPGDEVGFLLTDGEELGLAGAHAAVDPLPPVQGIINVEGLDDPGPIRVAEGYGWRREGSAPQLAAALLTAGQTLDMDVERHALPRTILVDHIPFAAAGIPSLTILRGEWQSLLRVHRASDSVDNIEGRGAAEVATLLGAALHLLRAGERDHLAGDRARSS